MATDQPVSQLSMSLFLPLFLLPVIHAEWRTVTTKFSYDTESFYERFVASVYSESSPYFSVPISNETYSTDDGKSFKMNMKNTRYLIIDESVPLLFEDTEYYWNKTYMNTNAFQICEYQITNGDYTMKDTIVSEGNGRVISASSVFYECGIGGTCTGLQCIPPNYYVWGFCVAGMVGLMFCCLVGCLVIGRIRKTRKEARERALREVEKKQMGEEEEEAEDVEEDH